MNGVQVTLRATFDSKRSHLTMNRPTRDTSSALKRRFGSFNFLRVQTDDLSPATVEFFLRPVVIWNMVFRALHASQGQSSAHVTMVCVNEVWQNGAMRILDTYQVGIKMSLMDLIEILNNPAVNGHQVCIFDNPDISSC